MTLRVLVLTTHTPHHIAFIRALISGGHAVVAVCEHPKSPEVPGDMSFQQQRDDYEKSLWFDGAAPTLNDLCPASFVTKVNGHDGLEVLGRTEADVAIAFGTGWIKSQALALLPLERWNLHGGDPQKYRGLDSHLWALYHRDSQALVTTVHALDPDLDSGAIIASRPVELAEAPELYMLRAANTENGSSLAVGSLAHLEAVGGVPRMTQTTVGRYYSSLPDELLNTCMKRYAGLDRTNLGAQ